MCIFCDIVKGKMPCDKVYEDENYFAFKDIRPKAPIHILIVPKKHIEKVADIDDENKNTIGDMVVVANKIAKDLNIDKSGYRLIINNGPNAGQEVYHLHLHLMGGKRMIFTA
ncbi:MAG: histidine triad nucleotide-binding protein [Deltaproteobacteria bacterium]|nr:histidine triad nucleotide-binding protein [Deltaproteobacteria bacterium]